ncbi:hypothetical protein HJC99_03515 [Candidatus Saccharibacteria bacterium]|nr:hypothetical protein [Candidatus Saccharibacteria bacterium]
MNNAEVTLVILLSITLFILLVLSIVVLSIFIKILGNVRKISERAEDVTANLADISAMVGKKVAPVALSAAVAAALRRFKSNSKE